MILFHDVPLDCINHAALKYHVPAALIISVIETEGGKNGTVSKNKNGSVDLGVMQINSTWVSSLKSKGITKEDLKFNSCINVEVGTWILANGLAKEEGWKGIGNYNSQTLRFNKIYRDKVKAKYDHTYKIIYRDV